MIGIGFGVIGICLLISILFVFLTPACVKPITYFMIFLSMASIFGLGVFTYMETDD